MSDTPTSPPSPDIAAQVTELTAAVKQLADSQKSFVDQLHTLHLSPPAAPASAQLSAAEIQRLVADSLAQHAQATRVSGARDRYAADKMRDLPSVYQQQLPLTDDPATLASEEQRIRARYQADFKTAYPGHAPDISGGRPSGAKPADLLDLSRLSPTQLIAKGLEQSTPTSATTRTQPAVAAAGI